MRWFTIIHLVPWLLLGCPDTDIEVGPDDDTVADDDDDTTSEPDDDDSATPLDGDGDGWTVEDGDCDDADPTVNPGATDSPCDALDSDCDGVGADPAAAAIDDVEYPSFAEAMDIIADGQTLEICPGTHTESIEVGEDRQLTITSYSGDQEDTILDGEGVRQIVRIGLRSEATVSRLSIRNGLGVDEVHEYFCGGGILALGSYLSIEDCAFLDNRVDQQYGRGAALCLRSELNDAEPSQLWITESHFEGNGSTADRTIGGAVYVYVHAATTVGITDTTFVSNSCDGGAGALWVQGDLLFLSMADCSFEDNTTGNNEVVGSDGGAVVIRDWGSVDIANTAFTNNSSGHGGGALQIDGTDATGVTVFIRECHFEGNEAAELDGGALGFDVGSGDVASLSLERTTFIDNTAYSGGGGAHIGNPTAVQVEECTFSGNEAGRYGGGAVQIDDWDSIRIVDSAFTSNHGWDGGALCLAAPAIDEGVGEIENTTFDGNTSEYDGGAVNVNYGSTEAVSLRISDSRFTTNSCTGYGGALLMELDHAGELNLTDCEFTENTAGLIGGAMNLSADTLTFEMVRGSITGNQAMHNGGAIKFAAYWAEQPYDAQLLHVTVEDNTVTDEDGAAIAISDPASVVLESCSIQRNTGGGVLLWESADATLASIETTWGEGVDDNSPWDVQAYNGPSYTDYAASETFACAGDVGCQ